MTDIGIARFRKNECVIERKGVQITGGVMGLLVGVLTPFALIYLLMSILSLARA